MTQDRDTRRYQGQRPPDSQQRKPEQRRPGTPTYQQPTQPGRQTPRQEQGQRGAGGTPPTYQGEPRPVPPTYGQPSEPGSGGTPPTYPGEPRPVPPTYGQPGEPGGGGTPPTYPGEPRPVPPTYGQPSEPGPETPEEPCPLPPPPNLCGPEFICYGPPEWGDDPCEDLCKEGQPWWKYPCKDLLKIQCDESEEGANGTPGKLPLSPCEGLINEPKDNGGKNCFEPCYETGTPDVCDVAGLQAKLEELKKCISLQVSQKAALDEAIKAAGVQQQELERFATGFAGIIDKYKKAWPALHSRESSLRGFFQKTKETIDNKLDRSLLDVLAKAINCEYCKLRKIECCKQTLEDSLTCTVDLIEQKAQAEREARKAEDAFNELKDLGGVIDRRFKELEAVQNNITEAEYNQQYRLMFYLFYWVFVPKFCVKYEPEICCPESGRTGSQEESPTEEVVCIGRNPGDWHPSQIDAAKLQKLLCCAWGLVSKKKADFQKKATEVTMKEGQLRFITDQYKQAKDKRDKTIRDMLETIGPDYQCTPTEPEGPEETSTMSETPEVEQTI